jgi:hypothetical protein
MIPNNESARPQNILPILRSCCNFFCSVISKKSATPMIARAITIATILPILTDVDNESHIDSSVTP